MTLRFSDTEKTSFFSKNVILRMFMCKNKKIILLPFIKV